MAGRPSCEACFDSAAYLRPPRSRPAAERSKTDLKAVQKSNVAELGARLNKLGVQDTRAKQQAPPEQPSIKPEPEKSPQKQSVQTVAKGTCVKCSKSISGGTIVQLDGKDEMHLECFKCADCSKQLGQGRHAIDNGQYKCKECVDAKAERCSACQLVLDGECVQVRTAKMHRACFKCQQCAELITNASFSEREGQFFHPNCLREPTTTKALTSTVPRSSSRYTLQLTEPSPKPSPSTSSAGATRPPTIFAVRHRPPANLGGLLVCAGCSVRATERETVPGPRGRRYHAKCLACAACRRSLDSDARLSDQGMLKCEECRMLERRLTKTLNTTTSK